MGLWLVILIIGGGSYYLYGFGQYVRNGGIRADGTSVLICIATALIFCLVIFCIWMLAFATGIL
ncbi:hypothetical protein BI004_gp004 [Bacillus phage NotTheCreek]|uniref:Uncharacterized protein n=1 Tax=Bacillus phage PPIsBest TaxID=2024234 RepID=A0A222Z0X8_9CAUD|nr:hypothetical protein BI004_gp004 [Bacillus phage NotTheCreek]AMW63225.1 hypothetical protein NOTTHECREEK_4 [Bacillus phage NotTheCreek]ASR78212.1 hypothetical protein PPISBEST_4 [Bacillus phage PPIsBest]QDH49279.1 hypothetical protein PHIREBALL_4 [Bacillus phage Phireball]QDH49990.1 hypothetical protein ALPS_3 [Bacillus phage ALPS]